MKIYQTALLAASFFLLTNCKKDRAGNIDEDSNNMEAQGFNFGTSKKVDVEIKLLSNIDEPLKGIIVEINNQAGETLLKGLTNESGSYKGSVNIPAYIDTLIIRPDNTGLVQDVKGLITNNALRCTIGGSEGVSGNVVLSARSSEKFNLQPVGKTSDAEYAYMGRYDNNGRPLDYLESTRGTVSAELLSYLSESLPEQKDLRGVHPEFLLDNTTEHLNIVKQSDVYITYVSEGATMANSLGYYTYSTSNPPSSASRIDDVNLIFPNCSALGSGGGMKSGDKVKLGNFRAGTSIGFVMLPSGWVSYLKLVNIYSSKYYTEASFNPESSQALKKHSILLNYEKEKLFLLGFEDQRRDNSATDHDFNDIIVYATSTVEGAISSSGVNSVATPKDTDKDGVLDSNDEFPNDPLRAFVSYFPSKNSKGTLAFEDNWPKKGDYDMNDLVISYRYTYISNASNKVLEMTGDYMAVAAWALNANGFGVQFPFASTAVKSATGYKLTERYVTLNANGTEAGQSKAVIVPFDNHYSLIANNTEIKDSVSVKIEFASPMEWSSFSDAPYNPFLMLNKQRGYEVHLAGSFPTSKADVKFFSTENDRTKPSEGKYYISAENWPWALSFTESFQYPKEGSAINKAYLYFSDWRTSEGTRFTDWYKNTSAGYRDATKIYTK